MALTRSGEPITVKLDGVEVTYLVPLEIVRTSGGYRLDYARFLYDLSQTGERVQNLRTPVEFEKEVEIYFGASLEYLAFRGWLHKQDLAVSTTEGVIVTASVLPQDFGKPISGMKLNNVREDEKYTLTGDILFNPNIDGQIRGNMSSLSDAPDDMQIWVNPESVKTPEAEAYRGETASDWVLTEALHSLTRLQMGGLIDPPDVRGSTEIDDDAIPVENVRIPFGATVPQALDLLTHPYGYDWHVQPEVIAPKVVVYRRGSGPEKTVTMQAVGETLDISDDPGATNTHGVRLSVDIGSRVNKLRLVGSRKQWEIGVRLYRGWATVDDGLTAYDLDKSNPDSAYYQDNKHDVWRLFVANEAGWYIGTRDSGPMPINESDPRDWSEFGVVGQDPRPLEDCLTYGPDGFRQPPRLEWSDDAGANWMPAPDNWRWALLETQLGVRFLGDTPPQELLAAGDNAELRICGTITGDECLEAKAAIVGRDPEIDEDGDVWLTLDVSDRYHYRQVSVLGDYKSFVYDVSLDADERDDTEAIQKAAEYLLKEVDGADIDSDIRLIGLRTSYEIGDLITSIAGRNIDLDRRAVAPVDPEDPDPPAHEPRYLQVMGIRWLPQQQETHLATRPQHVDPWYQPGVRPDGIV